MKKFVLTSDKFVGPVTFWFNEEGWLIYYHNEAEMNPEQLTWFQKALSSVSALTIEAVAAKSKGKLEELPEDLSFERFWKEYDHKVKKLRAEPLWKRMSDAKRLKALAGIKPYKAYLARTGFRGIADPDKYLREEYFDTNWNSAR